MSCDIKSSIESTMLYPIFLLAPSPPLNVKADTISATAVRVSWSPPNMLNGIIKYYTVVYGVDGSLKTEGLNSTSVSAVVTDLDPFTSYLFYVVAFTVELSNCSESDMAMTAEAGNVIQIFTLQLFIFYSSAPSAPLNVKAHNTSSTSILVAWTPPMTPNGIIRSYRIELTKIGGKDTNGGSSYTSDNMTTSMIIDMLEKFTTYKVQVFATTVEEGDGSEIVKVTTDEDSEFLINVYMCIIMVKLPVTMQLQE